MINKKIIMAAVILIGLTISFGILLNRGSLEINLDKQADIKIDNRLYKNKQGIKKSLAPKKYKITISREGYINYEAEVEVKRRETQKLTVELTLRPEIKKISEEKMSYPALINDYIFALSKNRSSLYKIGLGNSSKEEINTGLSYISGASWAPNGKAVILNVNEFEKPENKSMGDLDDNMLTVWYFNLETKQLKQLSPKIDAHRWFSDSKKVIYSEFSEKGFTIKTWEPENGKEEYIQDVIIDKPFLGISKDPQKIALYPTPYTGGYAKNDIFLLDMGKKEVKKLTDDTNSFGAIWSPDAQKILYTSLIESSPTRHIMRADGNDKKNLGLNTTSAPIYKAVFSNDSKHIYAAAAKELPENFLSNDVTTKDELWRINTETGEKIKLTDTELDIERMMVSKDDKLIYFVSPTDSNLYSIKIKE